MSNGHGTSGEGEAVILTCDMETCESLKGKVEEVLKNRGIEVSGSVCRPIGCPEGSYSSLDVFLSRSVVVRHIRSAVVKVNPVVLLVESAECGDLMDGKGGKSELDEFKDTLRAFGLLEHVHYELYCEGPLSIRDGSGQGGSVQPGGQGRGGDRSVAFLVIDTESVYRAELEALFRAEPTAPGLPKFVKGGRAWRLKGGSPSGQIVLGYRSPKRRERGENSYPA